MLQIDSNTTLNPGNLGNYSLPGLICHIRLRIGISHLSISGIVVHGSLYTSHCFDFSVIFYDCLLVDLSCLILFSCLLTVVWATKNAFWPVYWLSNRLLNSIIIINLLHYIIVYHITKLHYSILFYLIMSLFIIFTFKLLFDLVMHLLFYLVFVLLYLLSFLSLFIPRNLLSQKCRVMTNSFILR